MESEYTVGDNMHALCTVFTHKCIIWYWTVSITSPAAKCGGISPAAAEVYVQSLLVLNFDNRRKTGTGHPQMENSGCARVMCSEIMQGTMPGVRRRGRPRTAWIDNIKSWTGLSVEESIRMTEDRDKWRKYVHGVARIEDG